MTLAQHRLIPDGAHLMAPAELDACLGTDRRVWGRFSRHWEDLVADPYAAELGTRRLRRYGHFVFTPADGSVEPLEHDAFVQPEASNPLYIDRARHFEPLTEAFVKEPLLQRFLRLLGQVAMMLDDLPRWSVKVTPFRVRASTSDGGEPAPEGLHRDGVTLVSSLLIGRDNAVGGESFVFHADGRHLLASTLSEPGTLLLGDDRRTLHGVTPIRPVDPSRPARRDVLVVTFAPPDH